MQKSNGSLSTMHDCSSVVGQMYTNPEFQKIIQKIPESYRDDIKQEAALKLLEMPCPKVAGLFSRDELIKYVREICYHMTVNKRMPTSKHYALDQVKKAKEYVSFSQSGYDLKIDLQYLQAEKILESETDNIEEYHRKEVFKIYVQLGSARKVAKHCNLPINHVCNIVKKVKAELKCTLLQ